MLTDIFFSPKWVPGSIWHYAQKGIAGSGHNAQANHSPRPTVQGVHNAQYKPLQFVQYPIL